MNAVEELLGAAALARHGSRIALACGAQTVSYAELADQAARASQALASLGVAPGDRVLLLMRDTPEFAAAWLGAVRAGAVAIALNTKLTEDEFRHIRADSGARLAIVEDVFASARPDLAAEHAEKGDLAVAGAQAPAGARDWRAELARAAPAAPFDARPETPAFWLYSSGTTGKPKGIIHSHASVLASGEALRLLGPLALGATGVILADWADADAAIEAVRRDPPVAMFSVPTFYRRLLAEPAQRLEPFRGIRHFVAAGERLPQQVLGQWRQATGRGILSLYGNSEAYCACMMMPPGADAGDERTGVPLPLTDAMLRDGGGNEPAGGEPGVLWIRHPALAKGYANRPEQTAAQFRDGWFCTQDVFVRDAAGIYTHKGRADELLKIAGQWVQPSDLEDAAMGDAAIKEAACVAVADADGFERLALFVAACGDAGAAASAAALACERALPRYKRPKWVRALPELPRTATGKVQRYKLREILERELALKL